MPDPLEGRFTFLTPFLDMLSVQSNIIPADNSATSQDMPHYDIKGTTGAKDIEGPRVSGVKNEISPDSSLGELVKELKEVLGPNRGITPEEIDTKKVMNILTKYDNETEDWAKYALHDGVLNYTRNAVADINGNANLLVLVWKPNSGSPIHDHAHAHCCMKILKGKLKESLYEMPKEKGDIMKPVKETDMKKGLVGYISDDIGLHKMTNSLSEEYAVSLHLYTPPYASLNGCGIYEASTGETHHVNMNSYYSWKGKVLTN